VSEAAPLLPAAVPDPAFSAVAELHEALVAAATAYAEATGQAPYLAASVGSAMLFQHAQRLFDQHVSAPCATMTC
jgi:hypothetical protein